MSNTQCPLTPKSQWEQQIVLLKKCKTIAVVGMSPDPSRVSNEVGMFLLKQGFEIIPVHPKAGINNGLRVFSSLSAVVEAGIEIDLVDLFLNGDRNSTVVDEAIRLKLPAIWFQPGTQNPEALAKAQAAGLITINGACTMAVWRRWLASQVS